MCWPRHIMVMQIVFLLHLNFPFRFGALISCQARIGKATSLPSPLVLISFSFYITIKSMRYFMWERCAVH